MSRHAGDDGSVTAEAVSKLCRGGRVSKLWRLWNVVCTESAVFRISFLESVEGMDAATPEQRRSEDGYCCWLPASAFWRRERFICLDVLWRPGGGTRTWHARG